MKELWNKRIAYQVLWCKYKSILIVTYWYANRNIALQCKILTDNESIPIASLFSCGADGTFYTLLKLKFSKAMAIWNYWEIEAVLYDGSGDCKSTVHNSSTRRFSSYNYYQVEYNGLECLLTIISALDILTLKYNTGYIWKEYSIVKIEYLG